jgi:hypothetical protein
MKKYIALLGLVSLLQGCSIGTNLVANRFESSEVKGKGASEATFVPLTTTNHIEMISDIQSNPPDTTHNKIYKSAVLGGGLKAGLFEKIDVAVDAYFNSPAMLGAKYQWLGENEKNATKGNFSVSTKLALGYQGKSYSADKTSSNTTNSTTASLTHKTADFSVIAGKRLAENFLLTLSPFWQISNVDGNINQTSRGIDYTYQGHGGQKGISLGMILLGKSGVLKLDNSVTQVYWNNSANSLTSYNIGLSFGVISQ